MSAMRVAVVGAGFMAGVHTRAACVAGARLVAVVHPDGEKAQAAAEAFGADRGYPSLDDALGHADIDVVHICTPNHLHAAQATTAIKAGKPVVCEKPLATDPDQAAALETLAREQAVPTAVPFVYRYYPAVQEIRERVASGISGPLSLLHGSYLQDWLAGPSNSNWRVDSDTGGASRAFGDIGIHWCDLAEYVTGHRIERLVALTATAIPERAAPECGRVRSATEDLAGVLFRTDQGASGSLVVSQVSLGRKNQLALRVDGLSEAYSFDQETPDTLWIGGRDHSTLLPRASAAMTPGATHHSRLPAGHPQGYQDCFDALVRDFYAHVQGRQVPAHPTFTDGLRAARITAAVLTSARSGQWVDVN